MIRLRADQSRVAAYTGGYMAVPAVPGAGKTTVMAHLVKELIAAGRPAPGRVLVVTYMNSAVVNVRTRIAQFLEDDGLPAAAGYAVCTLHSLALAILRERPEHLFLGPALRVLDAGLSHDELKAAVAAWLGRHQARWGAAFKPDLKPAERRRAAAIWQQTAPGWLGEIITELRHHRLDAAAALDLTAALADHSFLRWGAEVYDLYRRRLEALGALDFDDLIQSAHRLLQDDPELCSRLRRRWTYIFEDEAQDSNPLQEEILQTLAGPAGNLVRVGDSNQAIMGTFTSADPALLRRFCARQGVQVCPLTQAGRSSRHILRLANHLVTWSRREHPDPLCRTALAEQLIEPVTTGEQQNPAPCGYTIAVRLWSSEERELERVAALAADYVRRHPDRTAAILAPRNDQLGALSEHLQRLDAPWREVGRTPEALTATVEDLKAVLCFLGAPTAGQNLAAALAAAWPGSDRGQALALAGLVRQAVPERLFFALEDDRARADLLAAAADAPALAVALDRLSRWLAQSLLPADELLLRVAADLQLADDHLALAQTMAALVRQRLADRPEWRLAELAADLAALQPAFAFAARTLHERTGFSAAPGAVDLSTLHRAKGLEWDTVYVLSVTNREFPASLDDCRGDLWFLQEDAANPAAVARAELQGLLAPTAAAPASAGEAAKRAVICERLRLLYVAITRARANLLLSAYRDGRRRPALALEVLQAFIAEERSRCEAESG